MEMFWELPSIPHLWVMRRKSMIIQGNPRKCWKSQEISEKSMAFRGNSDFWIIPGAVTLL